MQKINKKAFTLVELIVVITILAILGTIAFISLQGYSRDARDATRTADLGNINTSLELFSLKTGKYPSPDSYSTITYSGGTEKVWYQGVVGDIVTTNLKSLNEKPLDPLTNMPYTYSVTNSYKEYEVLALYEGSVAYNPIINQTNAAVTSLTPKIVGNYNGVFVKTINYIIPIPSIVTSEPLTGGILILNSININSQVITNGINIPKNNLTPAQTGALNINLSVYTGSIIKTSGIGAIITAMQKIQGAYNGTTLAIEPLYAQLLTQTTNSELVSLANNTILAATPVLLAGISNNSCDSTTKPVDNGNISYTINPTLTNQSYVQGGIECGYACTGGYIGASCDILPYQSCTAGTQSYSASTTYPGCNTPDIIMCSGSGTGYTISACNVGATLGTDYVGCSSQATCTTARVGLYFQWGNNHGFTNNSPLANYQVDASLYGPGNYYVGTDFIYGFSNWSSIRNPNLWGDSGTVFNRQGPCANGYHIPNELEWLGIIAAGGWASYNFQAMSNALLLPRAGMISGLGNRDFGYPYYWSSTPSNILFAPNSAKILFYNGYIELINNNLLQASNIRCFKN